MTTWPPWPRRPRQPRRSATEGIRLSRGITLWPTEPSVPSTPDWRLAAAVSWHPCCVPGSWSRPAGESPVRVSTGAPGSRSRFVVERRRAERGVKSLFGGSKHAGRSVKRTLQPRHSHNGGAEPLMSRRRPRLSGLVPVMTWRVLPGYGGRHVCMVWAGTGETRLPGLRQAKTGRISRW